MDGLAQHSRHSDRPMARIDSGRSSDRSSQARTLPTPGVDDASLTLGRRIGVLVVLAALGGAIVLAAGGLGGGGSQGGGVVPVPTPTPAIAASAAAPTATPLPDPPTVTPTLVTPKRALLRSRTVDLRVGVPEDGVPWDGLVVRIYRGTRQLAEQAISPEDLTQNGRVAVRDVPLKRGDNHLTAVLANAGGDGPRSTAIDLTVDDQPPRFEQILPRAGTTLNSGTITVRGSTDPGQEVTVRNLTTDQEETLAANDRGVFRTDIRLVRGRNTLSIRAEDAAGNEREERRLVIRGDGKASAELKLSRESLLDKNLPRTITARATVLDADGVPIEGARVVFIASPNAQATFTYEATTGADGVVVWSDLRVTDDAFPGKGMVSIAVTLPSGAHLEDTVDLFIK